MYLKTILWKKKLSTFDLTWFFKWSIWPKLYYILFFIERSLSCSFQWCGGVMCKLHLIYAIEKPTKTAILKRIKEMIFFSLHIRKAHSRLCYNPNWILKCPIFTLNTPGWANPENFRGVLITMSRAIRALIKKIKKIFSE